MPGQFGDTWSNAFSTLLGASLQRCVAKHELVSRFAQPIMRLQENIAAERRERFLDLVGGGPELDKSSILPDKSGYCLLISDGDGVVVESYLPDADAQEFGRRGLGLGGMWAETMAGTNGIDMAMRTGRVVTVKGAEHYFSCFQNFSCSSGPLRDAKNNLIGTLTLVGSVRRRTEEMAWCQQVLRIAGTRFQARLFRKYHHERMTARLISRSADGMQRFETIVACEEDGTILTSLPLWQDGPPTAAHSKLEGRHLSDIQGATVTLRGPTMVLPRRLVSVAGIPERVRTLHSRPTRALAALAEQGALLAAGIERVRKLAAHCVPLLICGETGLGQASFVEALQEDLGLTSAFARTVDDTGALTARDFAGMLSSLRFLCEYPLEHCPPTLIVHHVDRLPADIQAELFGFLRLFEERTSGAVQMARRPHLFFTSERTWADLGADKALDPGLLHLVGQAILELPSLRVRDCEKALDHAVLETGGNLSLSASARVALLAYDWPGNLRELRSVLREAAICGNGTRINLVDLPDRFRMTASQSEGAAQHEALLEALDSTNWNISRAARLLGKSRATVNRWIVEEGLHRPA